MKSLIRLIFLGCLGISVMAGDVDELITKIEAARRPRISVPVTNYISRTLTFISTLQTPLQIDYIYKLPDKVKIITRIRDTGDTIQACNGKIAWEQLADGTIRTLSSPNTDYLRFFTTLSNPAIKMSECFSKIEITAENIIVDKEPCYQLTCTPLPHFRQKSIIYYISRNDFLPRRADIETLTDGITIPITSWFVDYHNYNGLVLPRETRTSAPQSLIISRIIDVKINQEINDMEFSPPDHR